MPRVGFGATAAGQFFVGNDTPELIYIILRAPSLVLVPDLGCDGYIPLYGDCRDMSFSMA